VRVKGGRAPVRDEWIGRRRNGGRRLSISIRCARATALDCRPPASMLSSPIRPISAM